MGRKKRNLEILNELLKASNEAARKKERLRQQTLRAQHLAMEKARREKQRETKEIAKQIKNQYLINRSELVEGLNEKIQQQLQAYDDILLDALQLDLSIEFDSLIPNQEYTEPPNRKDYLVKALTRIETLIPAKIEEHKQNLKNAKEKYYNDLHRYENDKLRHERIIAEEIKQIREFEKNYKLGDSEAVAKIASHALQKLNYPNEIPSNFRLAYDVTSKQIAIEHLLPNISILPAVSQYIYVKTKDEIREKLRSKENLRSLYQELIASIALRTLYCIFRADSEKHIGLATFTGYVETVDLATGLDITKKIISVQTTRETFEQLDLSRVDRIICLNNLGARLSPKPEEAISVKPIVEFDMVDSRFVEESDILSDLDPRPNLMDLDWIQFENLVSNLFGRLGFEAKLTRSSRDQGVDAIAYDTRPIVGGKLVIQAKRYKNVVGVSAVRDLYGTMINEGASKGILVTTSHYGNDAYEFAKDKPIELIDGNGLLYLLDDVGIPARIVMPTE